MSNESTVNSIKSIRKERARCVECGYTWTAIITNSSVETELKCPRCKQKHSEIVE